MNDSLSKMTVKILQQPITHIIFIRTGQNETMRITASFNKLGDQTLRLCIGNKLRILNGRVTGDLDGKLTSYQYNGASTVDYGIISEHLQNIVLGFQVQTLTPYSDHCPITLKLACSNRDIMYSTNTPKEPPRTEASSRYCFKFLWNPKISS